MIVLSKIELDTSKHFNGTFNHIFTESSELVQGSTSTALVVRPKLVRQGTFTKDEVSVETSQHQEQQQQHQQTTRQFGRRDVRIVGGKVLKHSSTEEKDVYAYSDLRASVQRPRDNLALEGDVDYSKQTSGMTILALI